MIFRHTMRAALIALAAFSFTACVEEDPTTVGDEELGGANVVSFEVFVPASDFLVFDSAFSGYVDASDAAYGFVAEKFEDELTAHQLYRFSQPPVAIVVQNSAGNPAPDSAPIYFAGRLVLKVDTIALRTPLPAKFSLYRTTEDWDATATWTNRVDSTGVQQPWSVPGGPRTALIDTTTLVEGDSIVFNVDSATLAEWRDTTITSRGALITSETEGARFRFNSAVNYVSARSNIDTDTTVIVTTVPTRSTFIYTPTLTNRAPDIRIGGVSGWRTIVRLRDDLESLTFQCPQTTAACTVPLDSVNITLAQLVLQPKRPPAGYSPEDSMFVDVRALTTSPVIPLERSPVGNRLVGTQDLKIVAPDLFTAEDPAAVRINLTTFLAHLTGSSTDDVRLPPIFVLMQVPEASTFGFAEFEAEPMLRLIITTAERNADD